MSLRTVRSRQRSRRINSEVIPWSTCFLCTVFPCACPYYSKSQRSSLSSRRRFPLSPRISQLQQHKAVGTPQKDSYPPHEEILGSFHRLIFFIFPENGRDFFGHSKLQTVDSLSSAINGHLNHHHQNPLPQIYHNLPLLARNLSEAFHPSNSGRAWDTLATRGIFVISREVRVFLSFIFTVALRLILGIPSSILFILYTSICKNLFVFCKIPEINIKKKNYTGPTLILSCHRAQV